MVNSEKPDDLDAGWIKKNNQTRALIGLMVEDNQLTHIRQYGDARNIWIALCNVHECSNLCSKLFLLRKLYKKRLDQGSSMREHINGMMETVDQLQALGEKLKESHVAAMLLCSLPESYSTLITALEARPETDLTLDFVRGKLLDEYDRRRENENVTGEPDETVMKAFQRGSRAIKDLRECYYCHKTGHMKRHCRLYKAQLKNRDHRVKAAVSPTSGEVGAILNPTTEAPTNPEHYCFMLKSASENRDWYVDSGATSHMTHDRSFFTNLKEFSSPVDIYLADGSISKANGKGEGILRCSIPEQKYNDVIIKNVLYVPSLEGSLLSVKVLTTNGYKVEFKNDLCVIRYNNNIIATAKLDPSLYKLNLQDFPTKINIVQDCRSSSCLHLWHRRMGHRDPNIIEKMHKDQMIEGMNLIPCSETYECLGCIKGKTTNKPFPKTSDSRANRPFQLAHSDVCGPMKTPTHQGKRYMLVIVDDFSRYSETYLMIRKSEVEINIQQYITKGINKFNWTLQTLRSDGGGEFSSSRFIDFLKQNGIGRQITVPYSPQQNGVAERKNRSLIETARCMLIDAGLNNSFWGEAVMTANYLQNRLLHKACDKTPFQLWNNVVPNISHIRVFGCEAHAFVPKEKRHKFDHTTQEGILLGYSEQSKGYRIMLKGTLNVIVARTMKFVENKNTNFMKPSTKKREELAETEIQLIPSKSLKETPNKSLEATSSIDQSPSKPNIKDIRVSTRPNKGIPAPRYGYQVMANMLQEPEDWNEMIELPKIIKEKWMHAANEEIDAMHHNHTWDLVTLPKEKHSIPSRWVFKQKQSTNGDIIYRARLVAKGYLQRPGEDFDAIFAPVVGYITVRTLLVIAAKREMICRHLDAKTAFLQGEIDDEIYMDQPTGFIQPGKEHMVCRLRKSIYGLRQSARVWNNHINEALLNLNFKQGEADKCLYIRESNGLKSYILVYVDDLLVCADTETVINKIKGKLEEMFELKDLGPISSYLGINIIRTEEYITLDQSTKIDKMINAFGLMEAKTVNIPMEPEFLKNPIQNDSLLPNNHMYREGIGILLYLAGTTRPDISTATGILARRVEKPNTTDMMALKRIMRYLKKTRNKKIIYRKDNKIELKAYTDADWAGDTSDRKSTSGHVFMLGDASIAWGSRKQTCVSLSTTEAEYVSAAFTAQEAIWIKRLLNDYGYAIDYPIPIYEDNQGCINLASSEGTSARTKHIDVKLQFLKELQNNKTVSLTYCPTEEMIADVFTKPLPGHRFNQLLGKLNLID